jgi:hypothetical protein
MATVTKDFKVKSGLVVEGANATVNNYDILTKKQDDQDYIVNLIGGTATRDNNPDTVVKRDGFGNFAAGQIDLDSKLTTPDVRIGNAGKIDATDDDLYIKSWDSNNIVLDANQKVIITTQNSDIDLRPDGVATIWGNQIATQTDAQGYANDAANNAEGNANNYTNTAITNLNLAGTYDALGAASQALTDANSYTDGKVADLVDSAPALLDTLNELAAAIADNPNYASDVANLVATKADTTYVDGEISSLNTAAQGYANTAENNAKSYTDSEIGALTTDAIEEGQDNLYFNNSRVENAMIDPITLGTQTNISVTYNTGTGAYDFVAENGIADSTTSDLAEGSNLYFTDARAVDALEAVVPNFTEVDINGLVAHIATQTDVPTASQITAHAFDTAVYRSAEYTVKVAYGSHTELSKVMLTLDASNNIAISEYAVVGTNGSASTITADINAGNARLRVTTANNNSVVTVYGTVIK